MPSLSTQEINEFNAIKLQLINTFKAAIEEDNGKLIDENRRFIPNNLQGKRVDIDAWLNLNFEPKTIEYLKQFQGLCNIITSKLLTNNNSRETKVKKLTIYRKMMAEMLFDILGDKYQKNSYNLIPYALFSFPDGGNIVNESNRIYSDKTTDKNTGDNRVKITQEIVEKMIENAVNDLRKNINKSSDYGSKMIALELLCGRRQYEEILSDYCKITFYADGFFTVLGLAKASDTKKGIEFKLPYLGKDYEKYDGELAELLNQNLKILRDYVRQKESLATPLPTLMNRAVLQASLPYDRLLIPVRKVSPTMPMIDGKSHVFRKFYAFGCWVILDDCQSNEAQYFAEVLAEGTIREDGKLKLNLITAKSYSIFRLVDEL